MHMCFFFSSQKLKDCSSDTGATASSTDDTTNTEISASTDKVFQLYDVELLPKQGPTYESVIHVSIIIHVLF